jgi:hypothetical protein
MPRLLAFLPCEKVIINQGDNTVTLVSLMQGIAGNASDRDAPYDRELMGRLTWNIFTMWLQEPEHDEREYQQRVTLIDPLGRIRIEAISSFRFEKPIHRVAGVVEVVPVWPSGRYSMNLQLKLKDDAADWGEYVASYPLDISVQFSEDEFPKEMGSLEKR